MTDKESIIKLDEDTVEKLERLHYDYENYKDVIATCLDLHSKDPDGAFLESPVFKGYEEKANTAFIAYNIAKSEVERAHDLVNKAWRIDFATCELTVG